MQSANIPSIVTTDLSSSTPHLVVVDDGYITDEIPNINVSSPVAGPSNLSPINHALLSPTSGGWARSSLEPYSPLSPTSTVHEGSTSSLPSPTLSNRSSLVHFDTSLELRKNDEPNRDQGISSLGLLKPTDPHQHTNRHRRKGSNATWASSSTEPDHTSDIPLTPLRHVKSESTDITHVNSSSIGSSSRTKEDSNDSQPDKGKRRVDSRAVNRAELPQDMDTDPAPFAFKPFELAFMVDEKSLEILDGFGGLTGLLRGLGTDRANGLGKHHGDKLDSRPPSLVDSHRTGLDPHDLDVPGIADTEKHPEPHPPRPEQLSAYSASMEDRRGVYGPNVLPQRPIKSLLALMWTALKDKVLVILSVAAVVSLALGLFQDFGTPRPAGEPPVDWVEGVAIMVAIFIVVMVGSLNDWQKERQFQVLNQKKDERGVKVIRRGVEHVIDVKEVVVGDVAILEPGEVLPCDGVFLGGHNVRCDESSVTGESDVIKKMTYEECVARRDSEKGSPHTDCFITSGSNVVEGVGRYVVVAVGTKSYNGRIMMALRGDAEPTPLQLKLNALAELIAKIGTAAGLILFTALLIRFFVQLGTGTPVRDANQKGIAFVNILIISVTVVVVAVPEGLPLAVTLALAFATKRMTRENLLVRVLGSCETMANASVVCTDKTGTLTTNRMTVVAGSVGIHAKFVRQLAQNQTRSNAGEVEQHAEGSLRKHADDFSLDQAALNEVLPRALRMLFNEAITVNSTAFEDCDEVSGEVVGFVGSKTETALLKFAQELGWAGIRQTRDAAEVVQLIPFSSERKAMGVVVRKGKGRWRMYIKGASEILTKMSTRHVVVPRDGVSERDDKEEVETMAIGELESDNISRTIIFYANQTLRTIAICYRDFDTWPPIGVEQDEEGNVKYEDLAQDLTLIGITGIEDPLREGVREAVRKCHQAGVTVKMCTGDNVLTARSIAMQCGIYTAGGIIMEGPIFRQLSDAEMLEIVPRLQVLARSSPQDKKILVEKLKALGEIVGVTGDGTNDGLALKTAHVGFSMGIAGTEMAKEASDIILMDDNFSSIIKAIMWGRCVNDAVRKFLQFQVSTNVTAVIITLVSAVVSSQESPVLSAVQLLWINIIMDTFAALALATDPASEVLLERKPEKKTAPLFSVNMYKQILFQSAYQIAISLVFHFAGLQILGYGSTVNTQNDDIVQTLVFNAFVFAQIFNSINCRRLDKKLNVLEGMLRNTYFIVITLIEIAVQILIVFIGGAAFQVTRIGAREWGISLALGVLSLPLGALVRLLPNEPFEKLFKLVRLLPKSEILPTVRPDSEWNSAITLVRDNLSTFANVRGGRIRSSSFVGKSRLVKLDNDGEARLPVPSIMAMAPAFMLSSIVAGWAPPSGSLSDPAHSDPSRSSAALFDGNVQIHPDTPETDPLRKRFGIPKTS